jgi:hypothetical protein
MNDNTSHLPRSNTAKRNKAYGFNSEAELLQHLRDEGIRAERLHLTGKEDEGDLVMFPDNQGETIIQLKTWTPRARTGQDRALLPSTLRKWMGDLEVQRKHYAEHRGLPVTPGGMLIVRVKGRGWDEALVISQLKEWL